MSIPYPHLKSRHRLLALLSATVVVSGVAGVGTAVAAPAGPASPSETVITTTGLTPGQIKHVWLIILENKSYDATFTGLNQNSYLWSTLPSQGVLLTNYYGTGHSSMDNYISMVSGQAPQEDTQSDCSFANTPFGANSDIITSGPNAGQVMSPAGANAANGKNGCTYPSQVPTLFNQLDAAGATWKGYAQDLGNQPGREDGICGAPGSPANDPATNPLYLSTNLPAGVSSFTGAQANDQYVAKHFPFPWFSGLTTSPLTTPAQGGTDCDPNHIANLDSAMNGLFHDLQSESTTPAFSWITPNNCSDAHDALCKGNNLSGAFDANGQPVYGTGTPNPEATTPVNYTGGLYASDLFLEYYIPMIEKSPAFQDGGLIDITFDEANPPFTYTGNSFNNAATVQPNASAGILADAAGENINGTNVASEPVGPNSTLGTDASGNQLYPGPGNNAFIDRPPACTSTNPNVPANCVPGIVRGGSGNTPGARTDSVVAKAGSPTVVDPSIVATDAGRIVTDTADMTGVGGASPIPDGTYVGAVSNTGPLFSSDPTAPVVSGSFQLVDASGNPVNPTGTVTSVTLSAEGAPGFLAAGQTADPLYDATDATPGGGDTGSVLISPLIKPGTVSTTFYDHYSWLRTMEDIFQVSSGTGTAPLVAGTVSGGVDGLGHLGFAAEPGLMPFGTDVFNNVPQAVPVVAVAGVQITPATATLTLGQTATAQLTATVTPANATNTTVSWASSDTSIATVDAKTGVVTAVKPGKATITASATDGSAKAASAVITVLAAPAVVPPPAVAPNPPPVTMVDTGGILATPSQALLIWSGLLALMAAAVLIGRRRYAMN